MNPLIILFFMAAIFATSCKNDRPDPQSSPKALAEAIFDAARSGNYTSLSSFIDAEADESSRRIARAATDDATAKDFQQYFSKGKVSGDPVVNDTKASVNILFGLDGAQEETFEMVKREGKWYLQSF